MRTQELYPVATIAAQEARRRLDTLDRLEDAGKLAPQRAGHMRRCWLAIAAACGAQRQLPELQAEVSAIHPIGETRTYFLQPDDCAPRADWQAELERARHAATDEAVRLLLNQLHHWIVRPGIACVALGLAMIAHNIATSTGVI